MRLIKYAPFLLVGVATATDPVKSDVDLEESSRQLGPREPMPFANQDLHPIRDTIKEFLYKRRKPPQGPPNDFLRDSNNESYNEVDSQVPDQISMETVNQKESNGVNTKKNSAALSALALLGFLYFLNLIQGTNAGRKKREAEQYIDGTEHLSDYLYAIEDIIKKVSKALPEDEGGEAEGRGINDITNYFYGPSETPSTERAFRVLSYLGSLLARIPQALGFTSKAASRHDEYSPSDDEYGTGFWSMFGSRVGLIATIMDFLRDPSPSRIGRQQYETESRTVADPKEEYAEPIDLSEEDKKFLPQFARDFSSSRKKRFADDEMNIWYSEVKDPNDSNGQDSGSGQLFGMVLNLFKEAMIPS